MLVTKLYFTDSFSQDFPFNASTHKKGGIDLSNDVIYLQRFPPGPCADTVYNFGTHITLG